MLSLLLGFLEAVDPICFQEINQEKDTAKCPGDGIRPRDGGKRIHKFNRYGDVRHSEYAPAGQHDYHGYGCFAGSSQYTGDAMGKCQQEIE